METINAIIEPDEDGTLHVPLPESLRHGKVAITATLCAAIEPRQKIPVPAPEILAVRRAALDELRELGEVAKIVPDPVAWQRKQRQDRPLPDIE
ncbi:MAG: hypothetical protein HUU46_16505 [Candidatus Hydrogenedentes bacterium]|nr:hypothetical protein [Candidatus Hydrogenedentota bacterium]